MKVLKIKEYLKSEESEISLSGRVVQRISSDPGFLKLVGDALPAVFAVCGGARNFSAVARMVGCDRRRAKKHISHLLRIGVLSGFGSFLDSAGVYQNSTGCTKKVQGVYQNGTVENGDLGGDTSFNILSLRDSMPGAHALQSAGQVSEFDPKEILDTWCSVFKTIHDPRRTPTWRSVFQDFKPADIACGYDALVTEFQTNWNSGKTPNLGTLRKFIEAEVDRKKRKKEEVDAGSRRPERKALEARPRHSKPTPEGLERAAALMAELKAEKAKRDMQLVRFGGGK